MTASELLANLAARGIALRIVDGRIQAKPVSAVLPADREQLRCLKSELLALIQGAACIDDVLTHEERKRLMTETCDRARLQYRNREIDWKTIDSVNNRISQTLCRSEFMTLLSEYETAIAGPSVIVAGIPASRRHESHGSQTPALIQKKLVPE